MLCTAAVAEVGWPAEQEITADKVVCVGMPWGSGKALRGVVNPVVSRRQQKCSNGHKSNRPSSRTGNMTPKVDFQRQSACFVYERRKIPAVESLRTVVPAYRVAVNLSPAWSVFIVFSVVSVDRLLGQQSVRPFRTR